MQNNLGLPCWAYPWENGSRELDEFVQRPFLRDQSRFAIGNAEVIRNQSTNWIDAHKEVPLKLYYADQVHYKREREHVGLKQSYLKDMCAAQRWLERLVDVAYTVYNQMHDTRFR